MSLQTRVPTEAHLGQCFASKLDGLSFQHVDFFVSPFRISEQIYGDIPSGAKKPSRFTSFSLYGLYIYIWVCLKIVYPIVPNGFADHYPY